jgi:adenosine deaminase
MLSMSQLIAELPKAELHLHLEGTLEPELVFELADRNQVNLDYASVAELRAAYVFSNLQEFLDIYYVGMQVLQTEQDFYDLAMAYFRRARADNVRHTEAFFDPQAHTERGVSIDTVISGFARATKDASTLGTSAYLIPCFLRHLPAKDALETLEALQPHLHHFHAVGLDSSELNYPPIDFKDVYDQAAHLGLRRVAHAGEEGPPEYVWQAIDDLQVDRIDHGNRALEDARLVDTLVARQIPLTVCPLSNLKLGGVSDLRDHPLRKMLDAGLLATVNSDDPAYFGGYVNKNFEEVADALDLSASQITQLAKNSFLASFLDEGTKNDWLRDIDVLEKELGVTS